MNPIRSMVVGVAGVSMLVLLSTAPAFAADDTSYVGPPPPPVTTVAPAQSDPVVVVQPATVTRSTPVSGSLPFTGGDVAGLTLAGAGLTAVGAGLVVRSRRRRVLA